MKSTPRYWTLALSLFLLRANTSAWADDPVPQPDAAYGRIKLHEPLPKHAELYANWLHDRMNGFRVLIPPMSIVHCPKEPLSDDGMPVILRIVPHEMQIVDFALIPSKINGRTMTADEILETVPAEEKTDIFRQTSTVGTAWIGRGFRSLGEDAPPPTMTMLTQRSEDQFLIARFEAATQMEMRTALRIVDSITFVTSDFRLKDVLTMREVQDPKNEFVPARTTRAWFENDRVHGLSTQEDQQGRRVLTMTWLNWQRSGLEIQHWPSGGVYCLRLFENDVPQVQRTTFYESGEVHTMMDIKDGVAHGAYGVYYRNGGMAVFNENRNGMPHGERRHFLPDGTLYGQTFFDNGQEIRNVVLRELNRSEYEATMASNPKPHAVWNVRQ